MAKLPDLSNTEKMIRNLYDDIFGAVNTSQTTSRPKAQTPSKPSVNTEEIEDLLHDLNKNIESDFSSIDEKNNAAASAAAKEKPAEKPAEPETDPMEDLNALVGLKDLKKDVEELISLAKMQKMRKEQGLKSVPVSLHLVFSGNPGTGKTTVARILARLYKQIGVLSKGQLIEVDRSSLVAGYVGQTAVKTMEKIDQAMGGVLFIDEAYTLVKEGAATDYGQEAIDTILKAMEDRRDEFIVIVAGYTNLMKKFINSNPGLQSRFNKYLYFEDYGEEELLAIFEGFLTKYEYKLEDEARFAVKESIRKMVEEKGENFANAREVRNFFEKIITRQATRIGKFSDSEKKPEITLIVKEDVTGKSEAQIPEQTEAQTPEQTETQAPEQAETQTPEQAETQAPEQAETANS